MMSMTLRCFGTLPASDPTYVTYHDEEWGRSVTGEDALFERVCLEMFQVGLSWRTILHKRAAFREVLANFDVSSVARFGEAEVAALCSDARIIRNRSKIEAIIRAARIVEQLHDHGSTLRDVIWSHAPSSHERPSPGTAPTQTPESAALSAELRGLGFRFIGPVNMYAAMQACGLVNDHVIGCTIGDEIDAGTL